MAPWGPPEVLEQFNTSFAVCRCRANWGLLKHGATEVIACIVLTISLGRRSFHWVSAQIISLGRAPVRGAKKSWKGDRAMLSSLLRAARGLVISTNHKEKIKRDSSSFHPSIIHPSSKFTLNRNSTNLCCCP